MPSRLETPSIQKARISPIDSDLDIQTAVFVVSTPVFVVLTAVFVLLARVFIALTTVFAFPAMVLAFSTLVLGGGKMFSILDHPFSEAASILRASEAGISITEKIAGVRLR